MSLSILVTGGCGFVGRHLVARLLKKGREVTIVDNLSTGVHPDRWIPREFKGKFTFHAVDSLEFFRGDRRERFSDIYHLSAVVGGRTKIDNDPIAVALDLAIDAEFFNWAVKSRCDRILYASSSAAYPVSLQSATKHVMLSEEMVSFDDIGKPDMTYGWSKLTGEYLSRLVAKHYGISVACVRPFSGYGEDQDMTYPVPAITQRAVNRENPLVVWGSGKQGRDFVHIEDCIDAMLLAIDKMHDGSAVNLSSGRLTTFIEVAEIVAGVAGYKPKIKALENMPQGVHARYGSIARAKEILGWQPKISVEDGLRRVFSYLRDKPAMSHMLGLS